MEEDKSQEEKLLGDRVEEALTKVGADKIAEAYKKVTKKDCGCNKRKKQLNKVHLEVLRLLKLQKGKKHD